MKNKKITLEQLKNLILENISNILKEEELEDKDSANDTYVDLRDKESEDVEMSEDETSEFSKLSQKTYSLSQKVGNVNKIKELDEKIKKAINSGRIESDFNYNKVAEKNKYHEFNYFATVLATLYKDNDISGSEKSNIRKVLWESMAQPYEITTYGKGKGGDRPSLLSRVVAKQAGIFDFSAKAQTIDGSYYKDIIADSIFKAIDYALNIFDPQRGGAFPTLVIFNAAGRVKSEIKSKGSKTALGHISLDEPIGISGEERDETRVDIMSGDDESTSQKEAAVGFAKTLKKFIDNKLNDDKYKIYRDVYNLFIEGESLSNIADILNKDPRNVRLIKHRLEEFLNTFVKNGELQDYLFNKTGIRVNFPNNKLTLSTYGTTKGSGQVEPVEYFKPKGIDPKTGEETGEWVTITPKTHDSDTSWFDKYGDIVFGKYGESEKEEKDNLEPEEQDLTKSFIAEKLMENIKKRLIKEFGAKNADEEYLESNEYFVDTYINGQFSQLRNMLKTFIKKNKLKELNEYLNELGGATSFEIKNWIIENISNNTLREFEDKEKHIKKREDLIGKLVKITSDNENYDDYRGEILKITNAEVGGLAYDMSVYPEALVSFEIVDTGEDFPFMLYEYEFEIIG